MSQFSAFRRLFTRKYACFAVPVSMTANDIHKRNKKDLIIFPKMEYYVSSYGDATYKFMLMEIDDHTFISESAKNKRGTWEMLTNQAYTDNKVYRGPFNYTGKDCAIQLPTEKPFTLFQWGDGSGPGYYYSYVGMFKYSFISVVANSEDLERAHAEIDKRSRRLNPTLIKQNGTYVYRKYLLKETFEYMEV